MRQTVVSLLAPAASSAIAALALAACVPAASAAPMIEWLGELYPGKHFTTITDMSADGSVIVGADSSTGFRSGLQAFRWTPSTGMVGLGGLPGEPVDSEANGVSGDGTVTVGRTAKGTSDVGFRHTAGGGMVELGTPSSQLFSGAAAASGNGSVIVGRDGTGGYRWTGATGTVLLPDLPGGSTSTDPSGVSTDGSVIAGWSASAGGTEAFRYTATGGIVGLGELPGGIFHSQATAVSGDGSTVVGWSFSGTGQEAFRWTAATGMVGLGDLPDGNASTMSQALGVSADGRVVVGTGSTGQGGTAFYWTADGGMRSLADVMISAGIDPRANGWTGIFSADAVSADGLVVTGIGYRLQSGGFEPFRAVLPEPGAAGLLATATASFLLRRKRRGR